LEYTGINGSRSFLSPVLANPYTQSVRSDWLSTIRGRAGLAYGPWLLYGTGGLAIARLRFTDLFLGTHGVGPIYSSVSDTRLGWTAGAGVEFGFAAAWSAKLEYLHADFGSVSDVGASLINSARITHVHRVTEDIARLGMNCRWGGGPVVAGY